MPRMLLRTRKKTNPLFYAERLRRMLADEPERHRRALAEPENVDLLTWNLFASLDTDDDREFLAGQLRAFCGNDLLPPVRLSLWTGRQREPRLEPSSEYARHVRHAAGERADVSAFLAPIEVPVRIEGRNVLGLVDTVWGPSRRGSAGRDRLVELVDAGLVHAERLGEDLAVAVVYRSGTSAATEVSRRVDELRDPERLAAELPWLDQVPPVHFREVTWQQLVAVWEHERRNLKLFNEPVREFLAHAERLGLR
jgi:hypothetical protein